MDTYFGERPTHVLPTVKVRPFGVTFTMYSMTTAPMYIAHQCGFQYVSYPVIGEAMGLDR